MTIVKMRELLRKPTDVFEQLERTGEPVLLTRDGQAIAALYPVDPQQAEQVAMAALPEFVQSRSRASDARGEGRTSSAGEFLAEFQSRHGTGGSQSPPTATTAPGDDQSNADHLAPLASGATQKDLIQRLSSIFGAALSSELAGEVDQRIAAASEPVLKAAPPELLESRVASSDFTRRVHELNGELFGGLLQKTLRRTTGEMIASLTTGYSAGQIEPSGVFGKHLLVETLDAVTNQVRTFNCRLLDEQRSLSLPIYEACVHAANAIELIDLAGDQPLAGYVGSYQGQAVSVG